MAWVSRRSIGVGDPKKVTALEIWLFDKNDIKDCHQGANEFEHAFDDQNCVRGWKPRVSWSCSNRREQIILETATLQLLVTVNDLEYGVGALPPKVILSG